MPPQINVPMERIRVLAGDVGGGFGLKNGVSREDVAVIAAAIDLGRPVKWIEDRLEHLGSGGQAREEMADIEAAVTADGVLLGIRMNAKLNIGRLPVRPVPGRDVRQLAERLLPGPDPDRGHRRPAHRGLHQQGHLRLLPRAVGDWRLPP